MIGSGLEQPIAWKTNMDLFSSLMWTTNLNLGIPTIRQHSILHRSIPEPMSLWSVTILFMVVGGALLPPDISDHWTFLTKYCLSININLKTLMINYFFVVLSFVQKYLFHLSSKFNAMKIKLLSLIAFVSVSYTHLTLPTKRIV